MINTSALVPAISNELALPGLRHGFFDRQGGVSSGLYGTLNAGSGSRDLSDLVQENRARIAASLGVELFHLLSPYQFHSSEVVIVDAPFTGERPRADAIVTAKPGLAIGVVTADCGPLLLADTKAGVIAAAHAGWQGAVGGVIENTIAAMETLGASRANIIAVLGPTIARKNYEVGADFEMRVLAGDPSAAACFTAGQTLNKRQFDLPAFILMRLKKAGVHGFDTGLCTYANADRFFSYRRTTHKNEPDYGRQMSALCME